MARLIAVALLFVFIAFIPAFPADFSTDFDGTGTGDVIEVNYPPPPPARRWYPTTYVRYEQTRYQQQQQQEAQQEEQAKEEAEREAEERRLQDELRNTQNAERVRQLLAQLRQVRARRDAALDHDLPVKAEIVEKLPQFEMERRQAEEWHNQLLRKLSHEMNEIEVPLPASYRRYIPRVLFLGWTGTPDEALEMQTRRAKDPFDGVPYNSVFGFALPGIGVDAIRVVMDHFLLEKLYPTPEKNLERALSQLQGATIGELVVHSNGAAIAETMLDNDYFRVKTLRILGGDASLMNLEALNRLAKEKNIDIYVYANAGDVVPLAPTGWSLRGLAESLMNRASFDISRENVAPNSFAYQVLGFNSPKWSDNLHVQLLSTPWNPLNPANIVRNHVYDTYYGLLNARRLVAERRR